MGVIEMLQIYGVVSTALAGTSYFTLYKPAIGLAEEILDEDLPLHKGWLGATLWLIFSGIFSPITAFVLLKNNNDDFIEKYALSIANIADEE